MQRKRNATAADQGHTPATWLHACKGASIVERQQTTQRAGHAFTMNHSGPRYPLGRSRWAVLHAASVSPGPCETPWAPDWAVGPAHLASMALSLAARYVAWNRVDKSLLDLPHQDNSQGANRIPCALGHQPMHTRGSAPLLGSAVWPATPCSHARITRIFPPHHCTHSPTRTANINHHHPAPL